MSNPMLTPGDHDDEAGLTEDASAVNKVVSINTNSNPELDQAVAILFHKAFQELQKNADKRQKSNDQLLKEYIAAAEDKSWSKESSQKKNNTLEALRETMDLLMLKNQQPDQKITTELAQRYQPLTYSRTLQNIINEELIKEDAPVIAKIITDPLFSDRTNIIYKIEDEKKLVEIFEAIKGEIDGDKMPILSTIISRQSDPHAKVTLLRNLYTRVLQISDTKSRSNLMETFYFTNAKEGTATSLIKAEKFDLLLELMAEKVILKSDLKKLFPEIKSDQALLKIAEGLNTAEDVFYCIRYMHSSEGLQKIVEACERPNGFLLISAEDRARLRETAFRLRDAFKNAPNIVGVAKLHNSTKEHNNNKFVIGLKNEESRITIAWSNTEENEYHKHIFESLSWDDRAFPKSFRTGGFVKVIPSENKVTVTFGGQSADYGPFNRAYIERFKTAIEEKLQEEFGKVVEVVIEE